jgi:FkbM family methyltransferase
MIIENATHSNSNCIDVGCHKGEILDLFIDFAPEGKHYAFEPIPSLFDFLKNKYLNVNVFPFALSDTEGQMEFNYVKDAPAYSGLKERKYTNSNPDIEKIEVEVKRLDDIIPVDFKIDILKIDVEGGEYGVLQGAKNTIIKSKPLLIFEFGIGASDFYNTKPKDLYSFLNNLDYRIYTLQNYLQSNEPLNLHQLEETYLSNDDYYFVAVSKNKNK